MNISDALLMDTIDLTDSVNDQLREEQYEVYCLYLELVADVVTLLELPEKPIIFIGNSCGKDSLLVTLATINAYGDCLRRGSIEPSRRLVIATVNTLVESLPMIMLTQYLIPRIKAYAISLGINLDYQELTPPLNDEYFIRWGAASKLVTNASRSGDCTVILKTDVTNRYITQLMAEEAGHTVITVSGQRLDESVRRANNMQSQNVAFKTSADIREQLQSTDIGLQSFAPIRHWTTEQVFTFHEMVGTRPIARSLLPEQPVIPSFVPNHGLLIEIYGNGSNDVCSVAVGSTKMGAGCGGRARYGCMCCTVVTEDKSSEALTRYPRWEVLGASKGLRVRDFLFRLSASSSRAFHAKAIDLVGFHRICLQPNVLRSRDLEALVWFASQLAVDSANEANRFKALVAAGRELEHEGYADIYNDANMSDEIKAEMLAMYREVAQQPLWNCYSEKHAIMQSFNWSLQGIAALPFRPWVIYNRVVNGERRNYPLLNTEYEAKFGKISLANKTPEARVIRMYTPEHEQQFNPMTAPHFLSFHQRGLDVADLLDTESNCSVEHYAKNSTSVKVTLMRVAKGVTVVSAKLNGRQLPAQALDLIRDDVVEQFRARLTEGDTVTADYVIPFMANDAFQYYLRDTVTQKVRRICHTERVLERKAGKVIRNNTRLRFYSANQDAEFESSTISNPFLRVRFEQDQVKAYQMVDTFDENYVNSQNVHLDLEKMNLWLATGGREQAMTMHDTALAMALRDRTPARRFHGTDVAHLLLSAGGMMIKSGYSKTFMNMLKRTELLAELGAYDYANLSADRLDRHPNVMTMAQHRQDKIACVNRIRIERNRLRAERHLMVSADFSYGDLSERLLQDVRTFSTEAQRCITLLNAAIKVSFTGVQDINELNAVDHGKLAQFWLSYYNSALTSPSDFVALCLPCRQAREFIASREFLAFTRAFNEQMSTLNATLGTCPTLTTMKVTAKQAVNTIKNVADFGPMDKYTATNIYRSAVEATFGDEWQFALPITGTALATHLSGVITRVAPWLDTLTALHAQLGDQIAVGQLKSVKKLSFTERLKLMQACA